MREKIGIGVIGCRMGFSHIKGLRNCENVRLVAICDTDEKKLQEVKRLTGLGDDCCYDDYKELLKRKDVDAVIVATPDQLHAEQTNTALRAGKHVLCEKPMAMTEEECLSMIATSEQTGKKLMIGQIARYAPGFQQAKKLIEAGYIGDLFYVEAEYAHDYSEIPGVGNWRIDPVRLRHPALGGGCHAVDLLRWIAGDPIAVNAISNRKVLKEWPVDDCTVSIMQFPNEVIGKVMVSVGCKRDYTARSCFYGDKGTIIADNRLPYILVYKNNIGPEPSLFPEVKDQVVAMKYPVENNDHNTAGEIQEFVDTIMENNNVETDGKEGLKTVTACLAMIRSAELGGEKIVIDYHEKISGKG